ncbi:hypothetical protein [Noviherbaspirillum sp.]|jgi:hypothetical protein|uniref:hypothetical protein n=1 Tax=Noviherbaspirillum sp. TaxID=1926288 RepID=UPI0025DB74E1|nr:hypothetical protein [Noviherbaspirillum sp.]
MNTHASQPRQLPPEIARYVNGPTEEGKQFDFLIGEWDVRGKRYQPDGSVLFEYSGDWRAQYLCGGRIVMDEFTMHGPEGRPVSSFVTLRTYSQTNGRWEVAGMQALEGTPMSDWHGNWQNGEMVLEFSVLDAEGKPLKNRIRFFNIERDRFEWEIRHFTHGGQQWNSPLGTLEARRLGSALS